MKNSPENWQSYHPTSHANLPRYLHAWLSHVGSFMQRLQQHGVIDAKVEVVQEGWGEAETTEQTLLKINTAAWIREVVIASPQAVWMFARTVVPQDALTDELQQLTQLKNNSLGSVLFNYPDLQRSEFEICHLQPHHAWFQLAAKYISSTANDYWARRSLFNLRGKKLLLTEVFIPESYNSLCVSD